MKLYTTDEILLSETEEFPTQYTGMIEDSLGNKRWHVYGVLHRDNDLPTIIMKNGDLHWFTEGKRHRVDGPAIESFDGSKYWYIDGKRHRMDGPAIECENGSKGWCINDKLHRLDGPAFEYTDGRKEWYIDGKEVTELECKLLYDIMKLKGLL